MVSKEEFDKAYNQYPPDSYTQFMYKYFSKGTTKENMAPSHIVVGLLGLLFAVGYIPSLLEISTSLIGIATIAYAILLVVFVVSLLIAIALNSIRLKKIRKVLNISIQEYNMLVSKYYPKG
jgi:hypothetical protein